MKLIFLLPLLLLIPIGLVENNSPYLRVLNEDPQLRNELELALGRYYDQKQLQARQR